MNQKQRNKNRATAQWLKQNTHTCENCGERGAHWVQTRGLSLQAAIEGRDDTEGFWICPSLYGEDGRKLDALVKGE